MFEFARKVGCFVIALILGAALWHFRATWMPKAKALVSAEAPADSASWAPITPEGGQRARDLIATLGHSGGPAYVTVTPSEFAAYILGGALSEIARRDTATQSVVQDGKLYIRTRIRLADIGGRDALGPVARLFRETEPLLVGGTISPVRPGLAQFRLKEVAVRDIEVPRSVVGALVKRWSPGTRPDSLATDGLPIVLPDDVADVRLAHGKVTLYKKTE